MAKLLFESIGILPGDLSKNTMFAADLKSNYSPVENTQEVGLLNNQLDNSLLNTNPNVNADSNVSLFNNLNANMNANNKTPINTSDRNRRIGLMLAALSDAFAGRDIVGRSLERQRFLQPEQPKLTAAQKNLQAYFEIINNPNATQEQKRMARSLIGGIGQSPEQIEQALKASLVKQITPISERPLTQKEIEERLKTFRELNQDTMDDNLPFNDVYSFDEEFAKELVEKYKDLEK